MRSDFFFIVESPAQPEHIQEVVGNQRLRRDSYSM